MEIKLDNSLIDMASKVSQLQDDIQNYIDNQNGNDPRVNDFVDSLLNIQDSLSNIKGQIGDQIGGLIIDQIDNNQIK